ncbi:MAG: RNA polymerase recycling motor HelD [Tuberibacillus sp.]
MSISDKEWREEQQRVDVVEQVIDQKETELREKVGDLKEGIIGLRKNFWEDVTVNIDEPDDIIETQASIAQRVAVLSERERSHGHMYQQLKTLARLKDSPYFGRIDFIEDGGTEAEAIYIGIASLMDAEEEDFLIYDWRAPISSMYYDYSPGPSSYDTMDGAINGEMTLKRQYIIKSGKINGLFDTGVTIGDHMLQEVLGKAASTQMKSIVSTIQKEQNQIIRNERANVLVVQGVAGSGKTSAALQRVAYLLYTHRETLNAENIVLFSPNPLFNSYVSTVLPELGEENMEQTTYKEYVEDRLDQNIEFEDPFRQTEMYLSPEKHENYDVRMKTIEYKSNLAYQSLIEEYVSFLSKQDLIFHDIVFRGDILFSAEKIKKYFYGLDSSISIPNRLELVSQRLLEELPKMMKMEQRKEWVEEEIELLDKEDYLKAYNRLRKNKQYSEDTFNDFDMEQELLSRMVVKKAFQPVKKQIKNVEFVDIWASFKQLFEKYGNISSHVPEDWAEIAALTVTQIEKKELLWEDVTPYLYFTDLIKGRRAYSSIRHLIIDEAQDYSPFQMSYMKMLFPMSKMTLLGDINQGIYAHALTSPSLLTGEMELAGRMETVTLLRSYRSTKQIVDFTKDMIEGGDRIQPFNRTGEKPTVIQVRDKNSHRREIIDTIKAMASRGHETIAVIGKSIAECLSIYDDLKDVLPVQLMDEETYTFKKGLLVIPAYLAKGIEFDGVIIYNAAQNVYGRESERNLFYTACTRAMHELYLFSLGEVSPFIAACDSEKYVIKQG